MEMQQVRYFVALAETLNFTRAAERCNVSQPSLTRAIKLLEDELGGLLFHRERNNTHLTELGRLMEPHLREVHEQAQAARRMAHAFLDLKVAQLKLGITQGLGIAPFEPILERYAELYPETEIQLIADRPPALRESLDRGDIELAILAGDASEIEAFHEHALFNERMHVLLNSHHPRADAEAADLDLLGGSTVVTCQGCPFWPEIERQLAERGLAVSRRIVAGDVEWIRPFVARGLAIGLRGASHGSVPGMVGRPLADVDLEVPVRLATKRGRLYSPPVRAFVDIALSPQSLRATMAA